MVLPCNISLDEKTKYRVVDTGDIITELELFDLYHEEYNDNSRYGTWKRVLLRKGFISHVSDETDAA